MRTNLGRTEMKKGHLPKKWGKEDQLNGEERCEGRWTRRRKPRGAFGPAPSNRFGEVHTRGDVKKLASGYLGTRTCRVLHESTGRKNPVFRFWEYY